MKRLHLLLLGVICAALAGFFAQYIRTPTFTSRMLVVPHHEIVAPIRAQFFDSIPLRERLLVRTVVLASPNHFAAGHGVLQTTRKQWETRSGVLEPDIELIAALTGEGASIEQYSFMLEHGIYNVVGDIKKFFPNARIVPLLVKRGMPPDGVESLAQKLSRHCPQCTYVASVDYSHGQSIPVAALHDEVTLRAQRNKDVPELLKNAEVDSPEVLALFARLAQLFGAEWSTHRQTNTGVLLNDVVSPTTSHVLGSYVTGKVRESDDDMITFAFAGDTMFARGVQDQSGGYMQAFETIGDRLFWGFDVSIVNHEGAFSRKKLKSKALAFVSPAASAVLLRKNGVTHVSLGNNHGNDAGEKSYERSLSIANEAALGVCGDENGAHVDEGSVTARGALTMVIICVNATGETPRLTELIQSHVRTGAFVAIFAHWGIEYDRTHSSDQESMAHSWIDAGAGLIVGTHPHVVQDVGMYKGVPIVYSLGNFIFDQNFSKAVREGVVLVGSVDAKKLSLAFVPIAAGVKPEFIQKPFSHVFRTPLEAWSAHSRGLWFEFTPVPEWL